MLIAEITNSTYSDIRPTIFVLWGKRQSLEQNKIPGLYLQI